MPDYFYTAKSFDGQTTTGMANAKDEFQLSQDLKAQGLVLIKTTSNEKKTGLRMEINLPFLKVSETEKIMMVRNLGIMFSTGLSLVKSFDILSIQAKNKKLKAALLTIKEKIGKGESLSDALAGYPDIFSDLFINMIKVGEEGGTLEEIFQVLALQLIKQHELKAKIKNAMIYPCIILLVMFIVGIVIVTFVLPSLSIFFSSLSVELPIYTKILLGGGAFFSKHWYLLIIMPPLFIMGFLAILRTKKGKRTWDTFLLRLPLIAPIVKKNNSAFLIRSLSSMISAGVPLTRSLEISSQTVTNHYFQQALLEAGEKIKKGEKLSGALRTHQDIFPFGVIEMMEVGEETGQTASILKKLAEFYEGEAANAVERLAILIEPMLIIVLGLSVAFFAISIIQPMYSSLKFVNE